MIFQDTLHNMYQESGTRYTLLYRGRHLSAGVLDRHNHQATPPKLANLGSLAPRIKEAADALGYVRYHMLLRIWWCSTVINTALPRRPISSLPFPLALLYLYP